MREQLSFYWLKLDNSRKIARLTTTAFYVLYPITIAAIINDKTWNADPFKKLLIVTMLLCITGALGTLYFKKREKRFVTKLKQVESYMALQ